jgi:hypothetical protein
MGVGQTSTKAHAACAGPVRDKGYIIYNSDAKVFQYCDDTNWIGVNLPGSSTGGCAAPARD